MSNKIYPFDVHGAAQGIISFTKAGRHNKEYLKFADIVVEKSFELFYRKNQNDFIYRKGQYFNWNFSLMHWCNGWMARAIGEY